MYLTKKTTVASGFLIRVKNSKFFKRRISKSCGAGLTLAHLQNANNN
ncbi:MAG: hypothetical protein ACI83H_003007 [Glaciecola sp.]|jgi:hypothetical protein